MAEAAKTPIELTADELAIIHGGAPEAAAPVETAPTETATVETAAPEAPVEKTAQSEKPAEESWVKPEHLELAASYDLSEADLKAFGSHDEFKRFAHLSDRQTAALIEKARRAAAERAAQQQQKPTKPDAATQAIENAAVSAKLAKIDLEKLKKDGYDEEALAHFAKINEVIESREKDQQRIEAAEQLTVQLKQSMQEQERRAREQEQERRVNSFHDTVDSLGEEIFGKSVGPDGRALELPKEADEAAASCTQRPRKSC
jgi:hypothetical protein